MNNFTFLREALFCIGELETRFPYSRKFILWRPSAEEDTESSVPSGA